MTKIKPLPDEDEPPVGIGRRLKHLLDEELPEREWPVKNLLPVGYVVFAGDKNSYKSTLMRQLSLSVALGTDFLNTFPTEKGSVVYLALEEGKQELQSLFEKMLENRDLPRDTDPDLFIITGDDYADRDDRPIDKESKNSPVIEYFRQLLPQFSNLKVVIIDMLGSSSIMNAVFNYNYFKENNLMQQLHLLALELNISIIVVHHTRKMTSTNFTDSVSGTKGIIGPDASTWVIETERFENQCVLKITGKYQPSKKYQLEYDEQKRELKYVGKKIERDLRPAWEAIIQVFEKYPNEPELASSFIAKQLNKSQSNISTTLKRMKKKGLIGNGRKHGHYKLIDSKERN